jgi:hypothetical protein
MAVRLLSGYAAMDALAPGLWEPPLQLGLGAVPAPQQKGALRPLVLQASAASELSRCEPVDRGDRLRKRSPW